MKPTLPALLGLASALAFSFLLAPRCAAQNCPVHCHPSDSLELVRLYNALNGPNWKTSWNLNSCVKTWHGVTLDPNTLPARVLFLDLDGDTGVVLTKQDDCTDGLGLNGAFPDKLKLPGLKKLSLSGNDKLRSDGGVFPDFSMLTELTGLALNCTGMNCPLLDNKLPNSLDELYIREAGLNGPIPELSLPNLGTLNIQRNTELQEPLPFWEGLESITYIALSACSFQGVVPGYAHVPADRDFRISLKRNRFTFEDILPNWASLRNHEIDFDSMERFSAPDTRQIPIGCPFRWGVDIDDTVTTNVYQWFQNGTLRVTTDSNTLVIDSMPDGWGGQWVCRVSNTVVTRMKIESHPITVALCQPEQMNVDTTLCPGQSLLVNGVLYNEQNPMGKQQLVGKATNGCDSVIRVRLHYPDFRAAPDTLVCRDSVPLRAKLPPGATGLWTSDSAAQILQPTSPVTTASGLQEGETRLFWTLNLPGCPSATDTFSVFYDRPPQARLDTLTTFIDQDISGNFLLNDLFFDPDVDIVSVLLPLPSGGDFVWDASDSSWDFDPDKLYYGTFTVRYSLCSSLCLAEYCDTAEIRIKVVPERQPTFVSANGDGINDTFVIERLAADPSTLPDNELLIFSSDGTVVYRTQGYRNDWPNLGNLPPAGVYWCFFRATPSSTVMPSVVLLTH